METIIHIEKEYITLGQFLKRIDVIQSGGMARPYLETYIVLVDGEEEMRRGRKLYPGTIVDVPEEGLFRIEEANKEENSD